MADNYIYYAGSGVPYNLRATQVGNGVLLQNFGSVVVDSTTSYTIDLESLPKQYGYDSSGNLTTTTVGPDAAGNYFRQTLTYTNGLLTNESAWVKQ